MVYVYDWCKRSTNILNHLYDLCDVVLNVYILLMFKCDLCDSNINQGGYIGEIYVALVYIYLKWRKFILLS